MEKAEERRTLPRINADERGSGKVWPRIHGKPGQVNANEEIAKIAIIAGIAKIEKPTPTPLKHGGNGVSGGKKIAGDRAESHVSAVIGKATPTTEARRIAKIAVTAEIAKIEKPTPTPLKHRGNGVSGGKKIARYRAESHVSAVIGKATPTMEARRIAVIAEIAKIEKPTPTPVTSCHLRLTPLRSSVSSVVPYRGVVQQRWCMNFFLGIVSWSTCAKVRRLV